MPEKLNKIFKKVVPHTEKVGQFRYVRSTFSLLTNPFKQYNFN